MSKRPLLLIAVLLVGVVLHAATLTRQQALQRAAQFLAARYAVSPASGKRAPRTMPRLSEVAYPSTPLSPLSPLTPSSPPTPSSPFYIFNAGSADGFVIVSANDDTPPILGYADSGTFCPDSLPDNFRAWLDDMAAQIANTQPLTPTTQRPTPYRAPVIRHSITPLLTTTWNQNVPYNRLLLDTLRYTDKCYTGCVATAMAQLLNYHAQRTGRPACTTAYIAPYITSNLQYRVQAVEQGTAFDWAAMQNVYYANAVIRTDEQRRQADAVAQLMHVCGAAVRMNYSRIASGTDSWGVPEALKTYFGYDQATTMASRYDYTLSQWSELIYGELAAQRPVYITGASSGGGHAFIIDGFDGDEMFHFNWGWGGHCDGYYLLSLSNPTDKKGIGAGNSDDGYTMRQGALIGAQPDTGLPAVTPEKPIQPERNYSLQLMSLTYEGTPTAKRTLKVKAVVRNNGDEFYGNLHLFTKRLGLVFTDTCSVGLTLMSGQTQTVEFAIVPPEATDYTVRLFTDIAALGDLYAETISVVPAKPTSNDVDLLIDMQLSKLDQTGMFIVGDKVHMKTTVSNNTDTDYEGILTPILLVPAGFSYQLERRVVEAHSTIVIEEDYDVSADGRYRPVCITDIPDRKMIYQSDFYYYVKPSITIYHADGHSLMQEAARDMTIPPDAVAVDLRGNRETRYLKASANPNCVYFLSSDIPTPSGLGPNVVKGTNAKMLSLSDDGLPFMPIADFTADSVVYTRTFSSGMTVSGETRTPSWTTLCLPFAADRCLLADGTEARWMTHEADSGYDFWLMEFIGDEGGTLYFAPAAGLQAYTPYLVNVPGAGLDGHHDMTLTPVRFCGRNATIRAAASSVAASLRFKFVGTMGTVGDSEEEDTYSIDADGQYCRRANVGGHPFRACVKPVSNTSPASVVPLSIATFSTAKTDTRGDVNADGTVDVADISAVITFMANASGATIPGATIPGASAAGRADVNADGSVDVADISAIITIMSGNKGSR